MTARRAPADIIERSDAADRIDSALAAEPIDPIEANDPMEPIDNTLPTEPIDRIEFLLPMLRIDRSDFQDHRDDVLLMPSTLSMTDRTEATRSVRILVEC